MIEIGALIALVVVALWRIGTGIKLNAAASSRLASVMERDLELRYRNITPAPDSCPDYPPHP